MKRELKFIICIFIATLMCFSPLSGSLSRTFAASTVRYSLSSVKPSQFTDNEQLLTNLEKIFAEYPTAFTTTGTVCSSAHEYCKTYTSHQNHEHSGKGTQCFGYANYVYETLFGQYWDFDEYLYSDGTLADTSTTAKMKSEFQRTGACFGTIIRSYEPHSMVVLSCDDDGVWVLHANYGGSTYGRCNTAVHYYPWSNFASAHGRLKYIIVPKSVCEECVYTKESYPLCKECGHKFNSFKDVYAVYSVNDQAKAYSLPFAGCEKESSLLAGKEINIVREFILNGEAWLISEDEVYFRKSDMTFVKYRESMNASALVCPEYIIKGESFWLKGTVTSKHTITSLTVAIHKPDGTLVESNTIRPNAYSVSVAKADTLLFSELPTGEYFYRLTATDAAETKILYNGPFSVITSTKLSQAFPDEIFRNYIIKNIISDTSVTSDSYADKYKSIIDSITELDVSNMGIKSLKGIERFSALKKLNCSGNLLTEIDLSQNSALEDVSVSDQKHTVNAVYNAQSNSFTATLEGVFTKTYRRPMNLPVTEYIFRESGIDGLDMRLAIKVNADFAPFANLNPDEDSVVNSTDLSALLAAYGSFTEYNIDINFDGVVNSTDLSILLGAYGTTK